MMNDDDYLAIMQNNNHFNSIVLVRIQIKHCRQVFKLSTRASKLNENQIKAVQLAYELNYLMFKIHHLRNNQIR